MHILTLNCILYSHSPVLLFGLLHTCCSRIWHSVAVIYVPCSDVNYVCLSYRHVKQLGHKTTKFGMITKHGRRKVINRMIDHQSHGSYSRATWCQHTVSTEAMSRYYQAMNDYSTNDSTNIRVAYKSHLRFFTL